MYAEYNSTKNTIPKESRGISDLHDISWNHTFLFLHYKKQFSQCSKKNYKKMNTAEEAEESFKLFWSPLFKIKYIRWVCVLYSRFDLFILPLLHVRISNLFSIIFLRTRETHWQTESSNCQISCSLIFHFFQLVTACWLADLFLLLLKT